jgi:hypothetical protein
MQVKAILGIFYSNLEGDTRVSCDVDVNPAPLQAFTEWVAVLHTTSGIAHFPINERSG